MEPATEMRNFVDDRDDERGVTEYPEKKVDKGRCWGCCKTGYQAPGIIQQVAAVAIGVMFGAFIMAGDCGDLANVPIQVIVGGVGIVSSLFFCFCGLGFCCLARKWKPERDLRDEVNRYQAENIKFQGELKALGVINAAYEKTADHYGVLLERQDRQLEEEKKAIVTLSGTFDRAVEGLHSGKSGLEEENKRLREEIEKFKTSMEQQIGRVDEKASKLKEVNERHKAQTEKFGAHVETVNALNEVWKQNVEGADRENDEYKEQNERMGKLIEKLVGENDELMEGITGLSKEIDELREALGEMSSAVEKAERIAKLMSEEGRVKLQEEVDLYNYFIEQMRGKLEKIADKYSSEPLIAELLKDIDLLQPLIPIRIEVQKLALRLEKSKKKNPKEKKYDSILEAIYAIFPKRGLVEGLGELDKTITRYRNRNVDDHTFDAIKTLLEELLNPKEELEEVVVEE